MVPPTASTSGSEAGRLTCTGGPSSLIAPLSPEEATTVTCCWLACTSAACIRAAWARVTRCSPTLALIEITAACLATAACTTLTRSAVKSAGLAVALAGTRTTARVAPGAIACTISVSSISSSFVR